MPFDQKIRCFNCEEDASISGSRRYLRTCEHCAGIVMASMWIEPRKQNGGVRCAICTQRVPFVVEGVYTVTYLFNFAICDNLICESDFKTTIRKMRNAVGVFALEEIPFTTIKYSVTPKEDPYSITEELEAEVIKVV